MEKDFGLWIAYGWIYGIMNRASQAIKNVNSIQLISSTFMFIKEEIKCMFR